MRGLEPPRCHHHRLLRPARLPVPPHPRAFEYTNPVVAVSRQRSSHSPQLIPHDSISDLIAVEAAPVQMAMPVPLSLPAQEIIVIKPASAEFEPPSQKSFISFKITTPKAATPPLPGDYFTDNSSLSKTRTATVPPTVPRIMAV